MNLSRRKFLKADGVWTVPPGGGLSDGARHTDPAQLQRTMPIGQNRH